MLVPCGDVTCTNTSRSGSGNGTGLSSTAFTTEKIAVFAPMPRASADTAAAVNPRLCQNIRRDCRRSLRKLSIIVRPQLCVRLCGEWQLRRKAYAEDQL